MQERPPELTLAELKARIDAVSVPIPEQRLEMVRAFMNVGLRPIRAMDPGALRMIEPAVTFHAGAGDAGGGGRGADDWAGAGHRGRADDTVGADTAPPTVQQHQAKPERRQATTADDELHYATIRKLGTRFRQRTLSPVELATALLERVERLDKALHAFVTVTADRALADAKAAEAAFARGGSAHPLLGIPMAYKDLYATLGIATTAGSALLADWVPDSDATCVARLRQAGTVMLGKLITHEFAFGIQFPGHRFPPARNPWNPDHIPGGSSSGSGAALAAGLTIGSLGTDTGGSIRGPASFSGIVGLKPTYGRVSRAGVVTLSWTLDHAGPMARTVEDCAYLLQALAGHDPADPASSRVPVADYLAALVQDIRGLRVGVPRAYFFEGLEAEVEAAFERALETLRRLGATVQDVEIPSIQAAPAFMTIMLSEAFAYHERDLRTQPERYGEVLREKLLAGALITGAEYTQAQRLRARLCADTAEALRAVDVLAVPTTSAPAPAFATVLDPDFPFARSNMAPFNMTGLPALALPCGFSTSGLPLSLQIAGRPFDEATVLRVGHAYEQATEWHMRRPPMNL
jgi:aspartyl-tRNA(Asn)/glutamyl-tRNA(Gln) amidotransferase subunit A